MNKLFLLLLIFFSFNCKAQNSFDTNPKGDYKFTEKDIVIDQEPIKPTRFDKEIKEKYASRDFNYEDQPPPTKNIWQRFLEWLKYTLGRLFNLSGPASATAVTWTLYIVSGLVIVTVIYFIVKAVLNKEGQWVFGKSTTKKIISYDDIEQNLKDIDFEKLVKDTIKSGDYRLAIRYYYLWILKKMSEKSIIDWNPEKTNSDYLYEIKSDALKKDFAYVSYLYNYIWYGEFEVDETVFDNAKRSIEKTIQSI